MNAGSLVRSLVGLLALAPVLASAQPADDAAERKRLEGRWEGWVVEGTGANPGRGHVRIAELTITPERIRARDGQRNLGEGTYRLDLTQKPFVIESQGTDGEPRGKTYFGIYSLEGDTLKWCARNPGRGRPDGFVTKPGYGQFLMVLTRMK